MAGGFDSFLNIAIPIGIIIFFVGLIYIKLKEPINQFFQWFKSLFVSASDNIPNVNLPTEIVYR
jgi:hypothetical protein